MDEQERAAVIRAISGLMFSENFGDVHDEINVLRKVVGLPATEGDFQEGWETADWVGTPYEGMSEDE